MRIRLRLFASLRETLGGGEHELEVPPEAGIATVGDLQRWLAARDPERAAALLGPDAPVRCAVDQVLAGPDTPLHDGVEVAFFPPVTGG